jgi:hypothetical protein
MPREHSRIAMTDEELQEFLASDKRLVLATAALDGGTWGDVVAYVASNDRVHFKVPDGSVSAHNLATDSRVCCVVESLPTNGSYYDIRGAMMHGVAEPTPADDPVMARLAELPDPVTLVAGGPGQCFSIGLDDMASFVFAKIQYRYEDKSVPTSA